MESIKAALNWPTLFFPFPAPLAILGPKHYFTTTIYPHTKSLQNKAFEGTSLHWNPRMANMNIWKVSFQKAFKLSLYTIILSNAHRLKICKCKNFTSLSTHVSEQEEKLQHVEVLVGIPHKWGILIKQNQIWIALKEKKKLGLLQTQAVASKSILYTYCIRVPQLTSSNCTIHVKSNHYLLPAEDLTHTLVYLIQRNNVVLEDQSFAACSRMPG